VARGLADGLHIIGGRLLDAADALESGETTITVRDTIRPATAEDEALIESAEEAIVYFFSRRILTVKTPIQNGTTTCGPAGASSCAR
jgi:hypothetical protein